MTGKRTRIILRCVQHKQGEERRSKTGQGFNFGLCIPGCGVE